MVIQEAHVCLLGMDFIFGHIYLCANYFAKCVTNSFGDMNAIGQSLIAYILEGYSPLSQLRNMSINQVIPMA